MLACTGPASGLRTLPAELAGPAVMQRPARWWLLLAACCMLASTSACAERLSTAVVETAPVHDEFVADAVVESMRQTAIAVQVLGRITALNVKAGDRVKAGQTLLAIDQRAANQQLQAVRAQVEAARAEREVAQRDLERTQTLFSKQYVSQAALDRAQARYQASSATALARQAEARAVAIEPTLHSIAAPYAGTIASVDVELGAMATPGAPLLTLFDPAALRAVATVPQSQVAGLRSDASVRVELPDLPDGQRWQTAVSVTVLPVADPLSHTIQIRLTLPPTANEARPGMFARAYFPVGAQRARLMVPLAAVVRHTEVTAVYVVGENGNATLRQVRLGETRGDHVEILTGLSSGQCTARSRSYARCGRYGRRSGPHADRGQCRSLCRRPHPGQRKSSHRKRTAS